MDIKDKDEKIEAMMDKVAGKIQGLKPGAQLGYGVNISSVSQGSNVVVGGNQTTNVYINEPRCSVSPATLREQIRQCAAKGENAFWIKPTELEKSQLDYYLKQLQKLSSRYYKRDLPKWYWPSKVAAHCNVTSPSESKNPLKNLCMDKYHQVMAYIHEETAAIALSALEALEEHLDQSKKDLQWIYDDSMTELKKIRKHHKKWC